LLKAGLVVLNSLNFDLSEKHFNFHQFWMIFLLGRVILVVDFFPFQHFKYILPLPLACRASAQRPAVKHMGFPLYVTCCFSLTTFNILSLCLIFVWLVCVLVCFSLGLSRWDCLHFVDLIDYFLFHVGKIFNYNLFRNCLISFLFLFSSWTPII